LSIVIKTEIFFALACSIAIYSTQRLQGRNF